MMGIIWSSRYRAEVCTVDGGGPGPAQVFPFFVLRYNLTRATNYTNGYPGKILPLLSTQVSLLLAEMKTSQKLKTMIKADDENHYNLSTIE
jgi:hypothetical protein